MTYGVRLAIVGDITAYVNESTALRDFVYEANRGRDLWFGATREEIESRLLNIADI